MMIDMYVCQRKIAFFARVTLCAVFMLLVSASASRADLSANGAFTLLRKIPPGSGMKDARSFLGKAYTEKDTGDGKLKITRWGTDADKWVMDVLNDGKVVRAARVAWRTKSRSEQQTIFAQLTSAGGKYFERYASYNSVNGNSDAQWTDVDGKLLVRARIGSSGTEGVTLLSGIRDAKMDSGRYGF